MTSATLSMENVSIPGQQTHYGQMFPLVLQSATPEVTLEHILHWIDSSREILASQLNLHGAILLRGLPLATAEDLDAVIAGFGFRNFPYEQSLSNAVRVNRTERVFTANEAPADVPIYLHHEMAQTPLYPAKLFFFCEQAAEQGGETPLCRSDVLLDRLSKELPDFLAACERKGLRYSHVMPPQADLQSGMGRSWQSTFAADSKQQAETRLSELGYTWEWLADDSLRVTTPVLAAVRRLPSGRKSFFNQLIAAYCGWQDQRNDPSRSITLGDGTPLDGDAAQRAAEIAEQLSFDLAWQKGDVALVDNYTVMHGRRTFQGTRKVLASLVAAEI